MRWVGQVACLEERRENIRESDHLEDLGKDG